MTRLSPAYLLSQLNLRLGKACWYKNRVIDTSLTPRLIVHEVSHFQVASPSRRELENFGLGDDNHGSHSILKPQAQVDEECRAILLTIFWYEALELERTMEMSFRFKNKVYRVGTNLKKETKFNTRTLTWLMEHNLLDHNFHPTFELNQKEPTHE